MTSCGATLRTLKPGPSAHAEQGGCLGARSLQSSTRSTVRPSGSILIKGLFAKRPGWNMPMSMQGRLRFSMGCLNAYSCATHTWCLVATRAGLELICRAHQLVQEGLKYMFTEKSLVTVWSAPNYCYRCGNVASILIFDENLQRDVRYFTETTENSSMMAPRAPARYFW